MSLAIVFAMSIDSERQDRVSHERKFILHGGRAWEALLLFQLLRYSAEVRPLGWSNSFASD